MRFWILILALFVSESALAQQTCENIFLSHKSLSQSKDAFSSLIASAKLVNQNALSLEKGCVAACIVNVGQVVRLFLGLSPIDSMVEAADSIAQRHARMSGNTHAGMDLNSAVNSLRHYLREISPNIEVTSKSTLTGDTSQGSKTKDLKHEDLRPRAGEVLIILFFNFDSQSTPTGAHANVIKDTAYGQMQLSDPNAPYEIISAREQGLANIGGKFQTLLFKYDSLSKPANAAFIVPFAVISVNVHASDR